MYSDAFFTTTMAYPLSPLTSTTPISFPCLDNDTDSLWSSPLGTPPDIHDAGEFAEDEYPGIFKSPRLPDTIAPSLLFSAIDSPSFTECQDEPFSGGFHAPSPAGLFSTIDAQLVAPRPLVLPDEDVLYVLESDGDEDSDYLPSPQSGSRKRGRSTDDSISSARPSKRIAYTISPSDSPRLTPSPQPIPVPPRLVNNRQPPPPRNRQVHIDFDEIQNLNFVCPVEGCKYNDRPEEKNGDRKNKGKKGNYRARRLPDFKRHLKSHMKPEDIRCLGVRLSEAAQFAIVEGSTPYDIGVEGEEQYIGGCRKNFSRSDALVRHIRTSQCAHSIKRRSTTAPVDA